MTSTPHFAGQTEVQEVVEFVIGAWLHTNATPIGRPDAEGADVWTGCVMITGACHGAVVLRASRSFARVASSTVLALPTSEITDDAAKDVFSELTNVIGGNLKAFSSTDDDVCHLSVPIVSNEQFSIPGSTVVQEAWFLCGGHPLSVSILRAPPPGAPAAWVEECM